MTDDAVEAAAEYRVEIDPHHPGCECCGKGRMWWIVDSEGIGGGTSYGDECSAEEEAGALNFAFERGFLSAALAAAEAAAWQPIETAPPNVKVLLFCPDRGCESNCARVELDFASHGWNNEVANNMSFHSWATHWRPLPSPPMEVDRG